MKMKKKYVLSGIMMVLCFGAFGQIKIGDNPQNIDPASILELESTTRAFVINRVTTAQMNAIVPIEGAMVYNTDIQCLHYYDGEEWLNLCEALGLTITNNPIVHLDTTIAITRTDNNINLEVKSITGLQIEDRSITREDIALFTIGGNLIQTKSITIDKLAAAGAPGQIIKINPAGNAAIWVTPPPAPIAFGKVSGNVLLGGFGVANVIQIGVGIYQVILLNPQPNSNYTIQLTVTGENRINVDFQDNNSFFVQIKEFNSNNFVGNSDWYFTVIGN